MMSQPLLTYVLMILVCCLATGCKSDSEPAGEDDVAVVLPPLSAVDGAGQAVPDNRTVNEFRVLLMGNSHVQVNDLGGLLQQLLRVGRPQASVRTTLTGILGFLDERLMDSETETQLVTQVWSHVIVQGQKYSTSGLVNYSTDAAKYWLALIKAQHATPVLFPEHARYQNNEEGNRVYMLHRSIAQEEAACVAPVPLAAIPVTSSNQQYLRQLASAVLQQYPACPF